MFNEEQLKLLQAPLELNRIKSRSKANINLSYLEGFDLIDMANKLFGFGNWSYNITSLSKVSEEKNTNDNFIIAYQAVVCVVVYDSSHNQHISRQDVGFGTGIARSLADAYENSAKEAVTDALKRSLRSFGNQFGNSLYDKSKSQETQQQTPSHPNQVQNNTQSQANDPYEYSSLYNLGLSVVKDGDFLIIKGQDIFSKKDSIKACGFRWDGKNKLWYKPTVRSVAWI